MNTLTRMFPTLGLHPNLLEEVYFSSNNDVDDASAKLIAMGFELAEEDKPSTEEVASSSIGEQQKVAPDAIEPDQEVPQPTQVFQPIPPPQTDRTTQHKDPEQSTLPERQEQPKPEQLEQSSQLLIQPAQPAQPAQPVQAIQPAQPAQPALPAEPRLALPDLPARPAQPSQPSQLAKSVKFTQPIPAAKPLTVSSRLTQSAPIPIPSPNLNNSSICRAPPSSPTRVDSQKVGNPLKNVGGFIKKNYKKTIKELIHHDKEITYGELAKCRKDEPSERTPDEVRNMLEEIEAKRQALQAEKRKLTEDRWRFQNEVIAFTNYVQSEYKRLLSSQQEWTNKIIASYQAPTMKTSNPLGYHRYFDEGLQELRAHVTQDYQMDSLERKATKSEYNQGCLFD